jgi:hypothetical protein
MVASGVVTGRAPLVQISDSCSERVRTPAPGQLTPVRVRGTDRYSTSVVRPAVHDRRRPQRDHHVRPEREHRPPGRVDVVPNQHPSVGQQLRDAGADEATNGTRSDAPVLRLFPRDRDAEERLRHEPSLTESAAALRLSTGSPTRTTTFRQ